MYYTMCRKKKKKKEESFHISCKFQLLINYYSTSMGISSLNTTTILDWCSLNGTIALELHGESIHSAIKHTSFQK